MLDLSYIREHHDQVQQSIERRGMELDLSRLLILDEKRRRQLRKLEDLKAQQHQANDAIATATGAEKQEKISAMQTIAAQIKELTPELQTMEEELDQLLLLVPNRIAEEIHDGKSDEDNKELFKHGDVPAFSFEPKDHITLGKQLGIIDIERGVKIAGSRGYVLVGDGARLENALLQYGLDFLRERGFTQLNPPLITGREMLIGSGHFPGNEDETFILKDKEKEQYLIGTGEVPLMGYHAGETLEAERLPIRYCTMTPAFRTEVGSYGKDTRGLYRVRQFQKVEQVVLCHADEQKSKALFDELLKNSTDFVESLELPYRVIRYCAGAMTAKGYRVYDVETWMPSREGYGETHTCSEILDYQTRRLRIKYKNAQGKKVFPFSLNNTLVATPRILIALLEVHQQVNGSIHIPSVLQPYLNGQKQLEPL